MLFIFWILTCIFAPIVMNNKNQPFGWILFFSIIAGFIPPTLLWLAIIWIVVLSYKEIEVEQDEK